MSEAKANRAAIYMRLSKDDGSDAESNSISNQREILQRYAIKSGFEVVGEYVDDGISGTVFSRPGLDALLAEVRAGGVATVIIKDASRLGRDVYEIGKLKKAFEDNNVRLVAADGNLDTANGFDIMSIFRDVFNEWFVADTSKKIRAVAKAKALMGKHHTTQSPYGYMPSPEDKLVWAIDEPAAAVVREIFRLFISGTSTQGIANSLRARDIKIPSVHKGLREGKPPRKPLRYPDNYWRSGVVGDILGNLEYTGAAVMQKMTTRSYKNKKTLRKPEAEWIIQEDMHEPIISKEIFKRAKRLRKGRRKPTKSGDLGILNGLLVCGDCGSKLHLKRQVKKGKDGARHVYNYYDCAGSPAFKAEFATCTCHSVNRERLEEVVLMYVRRDIEHAKAYEQYFLETVNARQGKEQNSTLRKRQAALSGVRQRIAELDNIITRTFEHGITDKISKERFDFLINRYETEQAELKAKAIELEAILLGAEGQTGNTEKLIELIREVTMPTKLTREFAYKIIECVIVGKAVFIGPGYHNKRQSIKIRYNYIGE